jgi:L-2-hydroxyglutarate oxidase LhgO
MDTAAAMQVLRSEVESQGANIRMGEKFISANGKVLHTCSGEYPYDFMINAAGLDSLRIAQGQGFADSLRMVPFKGRYAISEEPIPKAKALVYPVPQPGAYVLGVHSTLTPSGHLKIGPTVFPAFAPENYDFLAGITPVSLVKGLTDYSRLLLSPKERGLFAYFFRHEFLKSVSLSKLVSDACKL